MIHENLVSVVVCTHNGARLLPVALDALARQRPPAGGFEVVVVDDHSTDAAGAKVVRLTCHARRSPVNTGAPPVPKEARVRVLGIQRKLHKWASDDPQRRFSDLHNLVCEPAVLMVARLRVRSNTGSRSAGVDGQTARHIEDRVGVERFLDGLREELRSGSFRPLPVKERRIPKRGGKLRRLRVPCEISSKHAEMSASRTHS